MTIAAHISSWHFLPRAKMAMAMKGCSTAQSQPEGVEEPETNVSVSQQGRQGDATEGKVIVDSNLNKDYEDQKTRMSQFLKKKRKNTMLQNTLILRYLAMGHSTRVCCLVILCRGSSSMACWLKDFIWLDFSPKEAKLLVKQK